ncbi:hypothetical protein MPOCJGCO_3596 [Methylobacterium trifolii]|uniref:Uncharacterized protein n=1 Tax=Methylobacterium trifolii TaxID=1003092 RepID=A0ABQ4U3P0_9HYPH|nr:hypothetical protein MPOCJGCO_3596 [Methylobacterium trifolii]
MPRASREAGQLREGAAALWGRSRRGSQGVERSERTWVQQTPGVSAQAPRSPRRPAGVRRCDQRSLQASGDGLRRLLQLASARLSATHRIRSGWPEGRGRATAASSSQARSSSHRRVSWAGGRYRPAAHDVAEGLDLDLVEEGPDVVLLGRGNGVRGQSQSRQERVRPDRIARRRVDVADGQGQGAYGGGRVREADIGESFGRVFRRRPPGRVRGSASRSGPGRGRPRFGPAPRRSAPPRRARSRCNRPA